MEKYYLTAAGKTHLNSHRANWPKGTETETSDQYKQRLTVAILYALTAGKQLTEGEIREAIYKCGVYFTEKTREKTIRETPFSQHFTDVSLYNSIHEAWAITGLIAKVADDSGNGIPPESRWRTAREIADACRNRLTPGAELKKIWDGRHGFYPTAKGTKGKQTNLYDAREVLAKAVTYSDIRKAEVPAILAALSLRVPRNLRKNSTLAHR